MISVFQSAYCAALAAWPPALAALRLWVSRSQVHPAGYVIRKPPYSPPLCWRQDGGGRNDPLSYAAPTRQFFLLYCLVDAEPANGWLPARAARLPSSAACHARLGAGLRIRRIPRCVPRTEDAAVPVRAGEAVLGDARRLHGAYANESERRRTVITLWRRPCDRYSAPWQAYRARWRDGPPPRRPKRRL